MGSDRFDSARDAYLELIRKDFPDFDVDEHAAKKALDVREADCAKVGEEYAESKPKKLLAKLDVSGDGKLGITDVLKGATVGAKAATSTAKKAARKTRDTVGAFSAAETASDAKAFAAKMGRTIVETDAAEIATTAAKIGKTAIGVQGIQDRKTARSIQGICAEYYDSAEEETEERRRRLNYAITEFGEYRLSALHTTVGRFLVYLKELEQKNKVKEYEILCDADFDTKTLDKMEQVDMAAAEALRTSAITGAFGAAAVMGTPVLTTSAVAAFATASTGTAISSLSGAAANSAVLAWLGGGSLAAGGGGMAAGTVALTAITAGTTAITAVLAAGIIVSMHYGKKLTAAKEYEKDVGVAVANIEKAWVVMDGIARRTSELREVTENLKWRTTGQLDKLGEMVPAFDFADPVCLKVFNTCAHFIKTMVELAQTPLIDDDGNLSSASLEITTKVRKILNTEV